MMVLSLFLQAVARDDDGLTLMEILQDIPHDAPAIVVYVLVAVSLIVVFRSGRPGRPSRPAGES